MLALVLNFGEFEIGFDRPGFLFLLLLVPIIWVFSFKSLAGLGKYRRVFALLLRTTVLAMLAVALAGIQWHRISQKVTVIYVLDQSLSIPEQQRRAMLQYVKEEVKAHRDAEREDRAGVIAFGSDAAIELPPYDDDVQFLTNSIETVGFRPDATNLASALKLAHASFPEDSAKRIVVVTDGNENIGNARSIAPTLSEAGIGVDVVKVEAPIQAEVDVAKIVLPPDVRKGQAVEARVVLNNYADHGVPGKLRITRRVGQTEQPLGSEKSVTLKPGKNVFFFGHTIDDPAVYTYRADFVPDDPKHDLMHQNNTATAFTHVRGKGRVLLIEDWQYKGEFDYLISRLRANNIEVTLQASNELFSSLAELQAYDCVVLGNVPRSSGTSAEDVVHFSDDQINMLVRNTEQMGAGLVMLGGPRSFGAGGWTQTGIEKAMPVDFTIKNSKVAPVGALVLLMHACEMPQGNFWQKQVARKAVSMLGPYDYCGMLYWGPGGDAWMWGGNVGLIPVGNDKELMMKRIANMTPGDMPAFEPSMKLALAGFAQAKRAAVKHMIIISDGDPSPPNWNTIAAFAQQKIQISTVAIGTHGVSMQELKTMSRIAKDTGGKYYNVKNANALPIIYENEVRKVARPLIKESINVRPQRYADHEIMQGIEGGLPPISGFVMTNTKGSGLAEVILVEPPEGELPPGQEASGPPRNGTILAAWNYGLGRTVAFTTDSGKRWANDWTSWENYDKFFTQMIRWAMRPVNEDAKYAVGTNLKDGKVQVVITALDKNDEFINFLNMSAAIVGPDLKEPKEMKVRQIAPGRYVGEFDAAEAGSYFVTVSPAPGKPPIMSGVTVPYSAEFSDRQPNIGLITTLASIKPGDGAPGKLIEGDLLLAGAAERQTLAPESAEELLAVNTFRADLPKAISTQDVWFYIVLSASCVFFADVLVRRVAINFSWIGPLLASVFRRKEEEESQDDERMARLRSRKKAIAGDIDERRASTRFEPEPDSEAAPPLDEVVQQGAAPTTARPEAPPPQVSEQPDEDDYTSRLLKAKKKAFREKKD